MCAFERSEKGMEFFMSSNDMLVQILKIVNDLKEDVKENRREIQKSREIEEAHWQENLRRWKENDKKIIKNDSS